MPSRPTLAALGVALLFLAGSIGYAVGVRSGGSDRGGSSADVGFLLDMIAHHEQAVEISRTALAAPLPPGVAGFALEVVADQQYEIGLMETTLRGWGHERQDDDGLAMGWMGAAVADDRMPGLASAADLQRLRAADRADDGAGAAALWLALMTDHHAGGVHMATAAVAEVGDPDVRALAERMARNQRIEINEYASARARLGLPVPEGLTSVPVPAEAAPGPAGHRH